MKKSTSPISFQKLWILIIKNNSIINIIIISKLNIKFSKFFNFLEQKLKDSKNYDEDIKFHDIDKEYYGESDEEKEKRQREVKNKYVYKKSKERIKNNDDYGESDETISNNDL